MYSDLNLESQPRVRATVVRGHITRLDRRESWPAVLVALPGGTVPQDADAVPHYRKGADGRYHECYGHEASTAKAPLYVLKEAVLPSPVLDADARFRQACWLSLQHTVMRYLMSNVHGRWDGAEKAHRHDELCRFYVAAIRGVNNLDHVRRQHEDDYQLVHDHTQSLTNHLDEAIGFPLDSQPDYDDLAPKFFERFHVLALAALE
ncbi:hypothetical protein WJ97_12305 [Burkholderia ubonensis]|uniref:hypothetical protein n=1 Tax=Burkholderia ubonensis TaxID=101571 RepID=UPI0007529320|nr:hypothetical protein [Burkholderia ubonensis]KVP96659.1 hypothetical protein WJ97_12305 [Burkholderia ubonensis]